MLDYYHDHSYISFSDHWYVHTPELTHGSMLSNQRSSFNFGNRKKLHGAKSSKYGIGSDNCIIEGENLMFPTHTEWSHYHAGEPSCQ